ncbi:hypothetical protein [Mycobacterium riyadhense]|uniref:hypothetical protein n=1 Tax=Mycobacterium riyadhense TaxID=486698 RepID=UPI00195846F3|nr:hypothetical protein [Mycobacterium riyadhense]
MAVVPVRRRVAAVATVAGLGFAAKHLRVSENRINVGKTVVTDTPKSKASNRTLPLPDEVVDVLTAARKRQLEERLAFVEGHGPAGTSRATKQASLTIRT